MTNYVLFKEFGKYCLTNEENYNRQIRNDCEVMKFTNVSSRYECLLTLHKLGYKKSIIDKTGE